MSRWLWPFPPPTIQVQGGAGLGSLSAVGVGYPASEGQVCQIFAKITMSAGWVDKQREKYAIIAGNRQFGYQRGNGPGINSGGESP